MAIDVCSEISSPGISPRLSFSSDMSQAADAVQRVEDQDHTHHRLDSSFSEFDFHFCFNSSSSFIQQLSSADELFSDGKILPINSKKTLKCGRLPHRPVDVRNLTCSFCKEVSATEKPSIQSGSYDHPISKAPSHVRRTISPDQATTEKKQLKEFLSSSLEKPTVSKSFWQFKRNNSLSCDSSTKSKGLIRSLQFLSKSNSTGSAPNLSKQVFSMSSKERQNPSLQKQHSVSSRRRYSISGSGPFYPYSVPSQKQPTLRKCGSHGNGGNARVSPVLNIPSSFISRGTINFFGFGSLFCSGKVRKKKI